MTFLQPVKFVSLSQGSPLMLEDVHGLIRKSNYGIRLVVL